MIADAGEPPIRQRIENSVKTALKSFDSNKPVEIYLATRATPTPDTFKWDTKPSQFFIGADLADHPNLLEFTTHCAAAHLVNNSYTKNRVASLVTFFAPTILLGTATVATFGETTTGALAGCVAISWLICSKLGLHQKIQDHFYKQAYQAACKKLIDQNNMKPIASYTAYSLLIKHGPLTQETRNKIIKQALESKGYILEAEYKKDPETCKVTIKNEKTNALMGESTIELTSAGLGSFKFNQ